MSIRYSPTPAPANPKDLPAYLSREFQRMSEVITNIADGNYDVTNVAPSKPRQGDVRFADGSNWNPGSGEGLYIYLSTGSWSKL
ncbi:MAG: hypothetical protein NZ811_02050 [Gammaproteobacteria bacterium]|nr:hypothetical protein [Gammaproteobacteria bacterium]